MLKIALAQINPTVGDLAGNSQKIIQAIGSALKAKSDVVVFPELVVCGYPPEDLLLKAHFVENNIKAINALAKKLHGISAIVGFVDSDGTGKIYNAAALICDGAIKGVYHKRELPNYGVFDEKRYFTCGSNSGVFDIKGVRVGVNICEDIWIDGSVHCSQAKAGAKVFLNISSSPYEAGKLNVREDLLKRRAKENKAFVLYTNVVGGQDELVFDGGSMAVSPCGDLLARAKQFEEQLLFVSLRALTFSRDEAILEGKDCFVVPTENVGTPRKDTGVLIAPALEENEEIYRALVMGTRDYVRKNGFAKVALGLSGGIDSSLVAVIAVDALGKENVIGISMPSQYNSKATCSDARTLARNLGIEFIELPIKLVFKQFLKLLNPWFAAAGPNIAEENIQARIRGAFLMAFANKFGWLILTTGNKSEMAVGYCTLYGDMSGGFAPLKDIFKTKVYALSRWRNSLERNPPIPKSILLRAPSAELRSGQTDEESLGPYEDLDQVLSQYIEHHRGAAHIAGGKLTFKYIQKMIKLVDANEYKRRQAPPGIKITSRAFGKDWRLPMTNHYKE